MRRQPRPSVNPHRPEPHRPEPHYPEPVDPDLTPGPQPGRSPLRPLRVLAAVAAGGVVGATSRYEISQAVHSGPGSFPLATFVINISGSLLLGALLTLIVERWPPTGYLRPLAVTGIIGAYTTWSTFVVDADLLVKDGHVLMAALYLASSLLLGLAAASAGSRIARRHPPGPPRLRRRPDVLARVGEE